MQSRTGGLRARAIPFALLATLLLVGPSKAYGEVDSSAKSIVRSQVIGEEMEATVLETPAMTPGRPEGSAVALAAYQNGFVWFENEVWIGPLTKREWEPYRGTGHVPLDGANFYTAIGRPDLASRYRRNQIARIVSYAVGGVLGLYGAATWDHRRWGPWLAIGGFSVIAITVFTTPDPVDEGGARRLADKFNQDLKASLSLAERRNDVQEATIVQARSSATAGSLAVSPRRVEISFRVGF